MFENYLINKYTKYIVGFAYETGCRINGYEVRTYFVLEKDDKIKVVKLRIYKELVESQKKKLISDLEEQGYEPLASLITEKNKKNKKKSLFRIVK